MLVKVMVLALLVVLTPTVPKSWLAGENPTGAKPVPERFTIWGLPKAFEESVIAPVSVPIECGA